jgi:hemolysin III
MERDGILANTHTFSKGEELANSITHGIGAVLSIAALVLLITFSSFHGNVWQIVSFTIFGATMFFLYLSSTLVHSFRAGRAKDIFEIMDHSAIYFFIAGTFTPLLFMVVRGWQGWTLFGIMWGLAVFGTVFKCFFVKKYLFTSTILYVAMGWSVMFVWKFIMQGVDIHGVALLVAGGVLYTLGSVFYIWRGFKFHHMIWHIFVLFGTICHFFAIFLYL